MDRREFVKTCGYSCLAVMGISLALESCTPATYLQLTPENNQLKIKRSDFTVVKDGKTINRNHVIVKTSGVDFPIVVYKLKDGGHRAMLMRCTHQGIELNLNGDMLTCSAHGSEFSNKGEVITGPADEPLKQYTTSSDESIVYVNLS
ncbi:MAG TPA: Rieske (2Fe-2S) protein [Flavobacteriales bacterium]|nr:Rieske (2Fe-2S) protein [Flavobacteriales bacterium]